MTSILLADDSPLIRSMVRTYVECWLDSYLYEASDGVDALQKAREMKPDLVILDLSMARMNGLDTARALRTTMADVPIILFTVYADAISPLELSQSGINALIPKGDISSSSLHASKGSSTDQHPTVVVQVLVPQPIPTP